MIVRGERCVLLTAVDGTGRLAEAAAAARYLALAGAPAAETPSPAVVAAPPAPVATALATVTEEDPYAAASPESLDVEPAVDSS